MKTERNSYNSLMILGQLDILWLYCLWSCVSKCCLEKKWKKHFINVINNFSKYDKFSI